MNITPINKPVPAPFPIRVKDSLKDYGNSYEGGYEIFDANGEPLASGFDADYESDSASALKGFVEALVERKVLAIVEETIAESPITFSGVK